MPKINFNQFETTFNLVAQNWCTNYVLGESLLNKRLARMIHNDEVLALYIKQGYYAYKEFKTHSQECCVNAYNHCIEKQYFTIK